MYRKCALRNRCVAAPISITTRLRFSSKKKELSNPDQTDGILDEISLQ